MSAHFKIRVTSDDPVACVEALHAAGIPTLGPTFAKFVDSPGDAWSVGPDMTAIVEAEDEQEAGRRVRQLVGSGPGVEAWREPGSSYDASVEF
jgi:hypothetical protein